MQNFGEVLIRALEAGQQAKRAQVQQEQEDEDRKLRIDAFKHQQRELELEGRYKALRRQEEGVTNAAASAEGQPLDQLVQRMAMGQFQQPQAGEVPAQSMNVTSMPTAPGAPAAPINRLQFQMPRNEEFGRPGYNIQPRAQEEIAAAQQQEALHKVETEAYTLNPGDLRMVGQTQIAENPRPEPPPRAEPPLEQQYLAALKEGDRSEASLIKQAMNARKTGGDTAAATTLKRGRLAGTVMANPSLWDDLTPTDKGEIAADLAEAGFTGFGRRLSDAAIVKMSDSRSAVASLRDLRSVLNDNEQYLGPLAGLQALNPYSEGRKAQADIDRVKQRVGKTLEGGVLRKEDEEKYKKILATLTDVPATAIHKVDQLIEDVERDLEIYIEEQRAAGRRVGRPPQAGGSTTIGRFEVVTE